MSESRPASGVADPEVPDDEPDTTSRPASGVSAAGGDDEEQRPESAAGSRPASGVSNVDPESASRPASGRPASGKSQIAWEENELEPAEDQTPTPPPPAPAAAAMKKPVVTDSSSESEEEDVENYDDIEELLKSNEKDKKSGCWNYVTSKLATLWDTQAISEKETRTLEIKTTIRELVIYLIFVGIATQLAYSAYDQYTGRRFTMAIIGQFEKIDKVAQVGDFWNFLLGENDFDEFGPGLVQGLHNEFWYNSGPDPSSDGPHIFCDGLTEEDCIVDGKLICTGPCRREAEDQNILYENKILGVPRLRQLRVRNDTCTIPPIFKSSISVCYGAYSTIYEDKTFFGQPDRRFTSKDAWRYQSERELGGQPYWGTWAFYGGGGSVQNLGKTAVDSVRIIRELREALWISRATRMIMIDFTVYNANVNLFGIVKLVFEFPPSGGITIRKDVNTVKLLKYVQWWEYIIFGEQIVFCFLVFYYMVEEMIELCKTGPEYVKHFWNVMDLLVIGVSMLNIVLFVYQYYVIDSLLEPLLAQDDVFGDFTEVGKISNYADWIFGLNVYIIYFKVFKYISFNKTMNVLSEIVVKCIPDLMQFFCMYFLVYFSFSQLGYLLFGTILAEFRSLVDSSYTMMRMLLGDFDFQSLYEANNVIGPMFFVFYIFFCFFILLNMFLAIINDTYSEIKGVADISLYRYEITDFFAQGYNNIMGTLSTRDKVIDLENAMKINNEDGQVTYEELRNSLKRLDFSDKEIELFFADKDENGDGTIDAQETMEALDEFDEMTSSDSDSDDELDGFQSLKRFSVPKVESLEPEKGVHTIVTNGEFDELEQRVCELDHTVGSIITKIDAVLSKMDKFRSNNMTESPEDHAGAPAFLPEEEALGEDDDDDADDNVNENDENQDE